MKSVGNEGVVQSRLQMLHIHVFLVAPLGACHVAEPCADQHQGGVPIRERSHHTCPAADLTIQPLDYIVGADARPMLAWEVAVGQRLLDTVLDLLGSPLQLHRSQLGNNSFRFFTRGFLVLLCMDRLEHLRYDLDLFLAQQRKRCGRNVPCSAGIWHPGTPHPRPPAFPCTCRRR